MPYPCELDLGHHDLSSNPMEKWESRSVYFLVHFIGGGPGHALYEVKIEGGKILGKSGGLLEPVCKLFDRTDPEVPMEYRLSATRFGSRSKLYLLQHEGSGSWWLRENSTRSRDAYKGCIFDTTSKKLMPFKMPTVKKDALLISAYGKLYHIAHPSSNMPDPSFEAYDPRPGSWTKLSTFPSYRISTPCRIVGYAVCYDCILTSITGHRTGNFWVYQVTLDQWKEVNIPSDTDLNDHYPFEGRAVVVGNTIYALSALGSIMAFSLIMEELADGSINYSLDKPLLLRGLRTLFLRDSECSPRTDYLVHLGGLNFCLLQTVRRDVTMQRVWITTFDIVSSGGRRRIRTLATTMRKVAMKGLGRFLLESGFSLECEDLEPKGKETMTTTSMIQPTDAPRLHKHEKATLKIIKRQIHKQKRKMMKPRSKRLAMMQKLFRPRRHRKEVKCDA
ncbi:hypothetical protein ABKV19_012455 [Rosa sericea]